MQSEMHQDSQIGCDLATLDINGDDIDDLAIGAQYALNNLGYQSGAVYVVYGSESFVSPLQIDIAENEQDLTINGKWALDLFGRSVAVGDLDGDEVDDLVVGATTALRDDERLGAAYGFFGSGAFPPHHIINLQETEPDITLVGSRDYSGLGYDVACGDINGDGLDDLCAGAVRSATSEELIGTAHIVFGRDDFPSGTVVDLRDELADVNFYGEERYLYSLGSQMSCGDLNGDGIDELNLHAVNSEGSEDGYIGSHNIFIGTGAYPPNHMVDMADAHPTLHIIEEDYNNDGSGGGAFSMLTDIDGDGFADIILGHALADRPKGNDCGKIYIYYSDGLPIDRPPRVMAGPGPIASNQPELRLWDPYYNDGGWSASFNPFLTRGYGVNPAAGDLDGDGYDEVLVGPGPGPHHPATVRVLDETGGLLWQFQAYGTPRYGVNVCAGDLDGDGDEEIVTGAGPGEVYGPHVRGWNLAGGQVAPMGNVSFLAYGTRRWGVNVACGDLDGDGCDEIITGAGPGDVFGPHVRGWNVDGGMVSPLPGVSFLAYGTPRWGVNVACGDIDGDGIDEIVTGPGPSELFGAHVRGWNCDGGSATAIPGVNFFAFQDTSHAMGCVVSCGDLDNDRIDEILTVLGPHPGNPALLRSWDYDGETLGQIERMSFLLFEEGEYGAGARVSFGNFHQSPPFLP